MFIRKLMCSIVLAGLTLSPVFASTQDESATKLNESAGNNKCLPEWTKWSLPHFPKGIAPTDTLKTFLECKHLGRRDLVDLKKPYGLNLEKVYLRQAILRASGYMRSAVDTVKDPKSGNDLPELSVNIRNLQEIRDSRMQKAIALEEPLALLNREVKSLDNKIAATEAEKKEEEGKGKKRNKKTLDRLEFTISELKEIKKKKERMIFSKTSAAGGTREGIQNDKNRIEQEITDCLQEFGFEKKMLDELPQLDQKLVDEANHVVSKNKPPAEMVSTGSKNPT